MVKSGMVMDMPLSGKEEIKLCESCVLGKNHCQPYPTNAKASRSKKARKFFHLDICGPMSKTHWVEQSTMFSSLTISMDTNLCLASKTKQM